MSEKKNIDLQNIHASLFSADDAEVEKALASVVKKGNELSILPIIELYVSTENSKFKSIAEKMLFSLKVQNASAYLMEALEETHYEDHKAFILSIFWNAGIPPHPHLLELTEEAVHGDFLAAFEVLTILENIDGDIEPNILEGSKAEVEGYLEFAEDNEKTKIIASIGEILDNLMI
ncbi:MAG: hypothetical protein ACI8XB_002563 [Patiriisocius sp.]|jgi:hypothetical protein